MEFELLNKLELISSKLGANPMLIQGPGGNSSIKIGEEMFIKASGKWLVDANKSNIFVNVAWKKINQNINLKKKNPLEGALIGNNALRPSIETTLHALMPHKVIFHTHPVELLSLLVQKDAKKILNNLLSDFRWSWVDYSCPGIDLTRKVQLALREKNSDILILGNHGLVVGSNRCEGVVSLTEELASRFKQSKRLFNTPDDKNILDYAKKINMKPVNNRVVHALAVDDVCYKYCNTKSTVLYPDQAVFLGSKLNCIEPKKNLQQNFSKGSDEYVIVKGIGVFVAKNSKPEIEDMLTCHSELLLRVPSDKDLKYLSFSDVNDIVGWEAEVYRQSLKR